MPTLATRTNAMPKIVVKPPEEFVEEPQREMPAEKEIFDKSKKEEPETLEPVEPEVEFNQPPVETIVEPTTKKKKPCSDKLKAHLQRCREKSLAKRRESAKMKQQESKPEQYKNINQSQSIDYDKIISGVSDSLFSRFGLDEPPPPPQVQQQAPPPQPIESKIKQMNYQQTRFEQPPPQQRQPQVQQQRPNQNYEAEQRKMLMDYEKKIREDERNRLKIERQKELDKTYKSKGMNVLRNGMPTHRSKEKGSSSNINPYSSFFGKRF